MELDRAKIIDDNFRKRIIAKDFPVAKSTTTPMDAGLDIENFLALFDSQLISRQVDLMARRLRDQQQGYYTISSSGHEGNAAIAKAFRKEDIAFLHYRSGAFMAQRAKYSPDIDILYDQLLSLVASSEDPISGGRHKVFGSVPLRVPPQTSTIASHLPKALGTAFSLSLAKGVKLSSEFTKLPSDSVVLCSFGDASVNHSTAQGAFNAAQWTLNAQIPLPLVWICEDNGFGISVRTPKDWIETQFKKRTGFHYLDCDGLNLADVYQKAKIAEKLARGKGQCVFLHMKTVRLLGHAGSDIEIQYRNQQEIEATEREDPLLHSARVVLEQGWLTVDEILLRYETFKQKCEAAAKKALTRPKLTTAQEIMASIIPSSRQIKLPPVPMKEISKSTSPRTLAQCLNMALADILLQYPNTVIFGEDVGKKGGVYRITADLQARFGAKRVFDTLLDEQTILGSAIGLAHNGFLPIPEIQFLAYTHNAVDQIRGEAATLSYFSKGQFTNPMVIRIPGLAYQKGFGGHFHNDNAIGFLREIPGIIIACPSNPRDGALLLKKCVQLAYQDQRVVIFLEPIALYMVKELSMYPSPDESLDFGELGIEGDLASKIAIISYGNGMALSRQAYALLQKEHNISVKLIDLRWLAPINTQALKEAIQDQKSILIVDECRKTGSLSEGLFTWMLENINPLPVLQRLTAEDCFIPLGKAWEAILPSCDNIVKAILELVNKE